MDKRIDQMFAKLTSDNREKHREAWRQIHDHSAAFRASLNDHQLSYLRDLFDAESDGRTYRTALKALLALAMAPAGVPVGSAIQGKLSAPQDRVSTENVKLLGDWLWEPFRQPSVILGVTATDYRRRDEGALLWLGRRLSFTGYPQTEFPQVSVDNPDLDHLLFEHRYKALCLVGRLGLFGQPAVQRLGTDRLQFGFDVHHRPAKLAAGQLDDEYHRIFERVQNSRDRHYRTGEKDGIRTDYAVVQRYRVELGTCHVVVVIIAGASSLGTLAAAQWAAYDLFRPTDAMDERPIEVPPRITQNSQLEALLCARARTTTRAWEHPQIELRKLYVDDASWSLADREWHLPPIRIITLVRGKGEPRRILFDGKPARLEPGRQMFRLMVAIAEQVLQQGGGKLNIGALAANDTIWENSNPTDDYVRGQLRLLRARYLKSALQMRGTLELRAEVVEVAES
jgi:hypothetical protein